MDGGKSNEREDEIPPVQSTLRPINVARPSEAVAIPISNEETDAGTNSSPTMPSRKVTSFAPSRFKPPSNNPAISRLREQQQVPGGSPRSPGTPRAPGTYDLFKTRSRKFSGPLEKLEKNSGPLGRQLSRMITRRDRSSGDGGLGDLEEDGPCKELQQREEEENGGGMKTALSAGRYFDALSGPELEDVKDKENLLLPHDEKWPFLLRFPIGTFGVALGLGSQTMLWKTLAQVPEMKFLHVPLAINFYLWCLALLCFVVVFFTYLLKVHYLPTSLSFFFDAKE